MRVLVSTIESDGGDYKLRLRKRGNGIAIPTKY